MRNPRENQATAKSEELILYGKWRRGWAWDTTFSKFARNQII